eukprot:gnl/TRDRNA2_/TRDRNA2_203545_c0_seq1.p1 gnl/TRDRNA2_/TRDRNA2_203545_c0~~gnl/TRDRNA2_/TRDRNA2_203545_c0_seq1.p1  ORF type:complete len:368 (-),score=30.59 gnl/TRDRNA2_/TRDRNA2_203545_c0_seq1:48-1151(-)
MCDRVYDEPRGPWDFHLACSPENVCWGYLDAKAVTRLSVPSGSTVRIDTVNGPENVMPQRGNFFIPPEQLEIQKRVTDRMIPGHILTGPVCVQGGEPGDVLRVDILEVCLRCDWAWTTVAAFKGALCQAFSPCVRHTRLRPPSDERPGLAYPAWGGALELRPFFGVIGVAPPIEWGRQSSIPPRDQFGGNMDLKDLVAGTTLFLPINVSGCSLFVGDGHALQGDGECCGTALETALTGVFKLTVLKAASMDRPLAEPQMKRARQDGSASGYVFSNLRRPRAESPVAVITMAFRDSFDEAAKVAIDDMIDWLLESLAPHLSRTDAYMFLSVAADVRVTQLVNFPTRGAHVVLPKAHLCFDTHPGTPGA